MIEVSEPLPGRAKLWAYVHDELILTTAAEIAEQTMKLAHLAMSDAFVELFPNVPIEIEGKVCQHWGEKT